MRVAIVAIAHSFTGTLLSIVVQPVGFHANVAWVTERIVAQMASITLI